MLKKNIQHIKGFWLNTFLSDYDLILKYQLLNKYTLPKLEKVNFFLPLQDNASTITKKFNSVQNFQAAFFFLLLFSLQKPFIRAKSLISKQGSQKGADLLYSMTLVFKNQAQIQFFYFMFFIEHWNSLIQNDFWLNLRKLFSVAFKENTYKLISKIPVNNLDTFNTFYEMVGSTLNQENFIILHLTFNNIKFSNKSDSIKNLPFFWKIK